MNVGLIYGVGPIYGSNRMANWNVKADSIFDNFTLLVFESQSGPSSFEHQMGRSEPLECGINSISSFSVINIDFKFKSL